MPPLTSKDILEKTGISRATLNNYISGGLLPRPDVLPPEPGEGAPPRIGYFPEDTIERIRDIQRLKSEGWSITRIAQHFEQGGAMPPPRSPASPAVTAPAQPKAAPSAARPPTAPAFDDIDHASYAVGSQFQLLWSNPQARSGALGTLLALPADPLPSAGILGILMAGGARQRDDLIGFHVEVARQRNVRAEDLCRGLSPADTQRVMATYAQPSRLEPGALARIRLHEVENRPLSVYAIHLRRGVLFVYGAETGAPAQLSTAATPRQAAPAAPGPAELERLAVLVGHLQDSHQLWQQLPAEEYFELANDVWAMAAPIIGCSGGVHARHEGEGITAFFLAREDASYLLKAIGAAQEIREAMRLVSRRWQVRKGWAQELCLNIGLADGEDWIGASPSGRGSLSSVLGDASQQATALAGAGRGGVVWATRNLLGKLSPSERGALRYGARRASEFIDGCFMQAADLAGEPATPEGAANSFAAAEILPAPAPATPEVAASPPLHS